MIHRDFCNPTYTKEYSALRMQFHFLISRYTCRDGHVFLSLKDMAEKLSCSMQSIYKFIRKGIREGSLAQHNGRLYLLRRVDDYTRGYVKHYPFLESDEFRNMSLHAQRFVLYALWSGVHTGRPLKRALTVLYHSTKQYQGVLNIYTKKELEAVLQEAAAFLKLEITTVRGIEKVTVRGLREKYAHQPVLENAGEHEWLDHELVKLDCEDLVPKAARQDLLKMKSEYIKKFADAGAELFSKALHKLASSYKLLNQELTKEGEIGRYFRSILGELEAKILPYLKKQLAMAKNALQTTQFLPVQPASPEGYLVDHWVARFTERVNQLQQLIGSIAGTQPVAFQAPAPALPVMSRFPFYNWLEAEED